MATHVDRSIVVDAPVRTVYDQWTRFPDFPRFMSGVEQVRRISDALTHSAADAAGVRRERDAVVVEMVPDEKIAWGATTEAVNAGAASFEAVGTSRTRVRLTIDVKPEGPVDRVDDALDLVERRAAAYLHRFKQFIESRGGPGYGTAGAPGADTESGDREQDVTAPDDPAAGWLTGYPGPRIRHTTAGAQGPNDPAAGFVTGYPGDRTPRHTGGATQGVDATTVDTRDDGPDPRADDTHQPPTR